jgi:hypothetical protein
VGFSEAAKSHSFDNSDDVQLLNTFVRKETLQVYQYLQLSGMNQKSGQSQIDDIIAQVSHNVQNYQQTPVGI